MAGRGARNKCGRGLDNIRGGYGILDHVMGYTVGCDETERDMGTPETPSRGKRLGRLIERAGLSLNEVARRASIHPAILSDLVRDTGTRRLMSYARTLRLVLGEEVTALVAEEERERAEAEGLKAMAAQLTARLDQAASGLLADGYPKLGWAWTEDPEQVAAELASRPERHRLLLEHQARVAAALSPELLAERAGVTLAGSDRKIAEAVCAKWHWLLAED